MAGIVAIMGRPNVGKSTLFNRLIEEQRAIVDDLPGVTRDRNYGEAQWNGRSFTVIDTGGFVPESEDVFDRAIREQIDLALEEADVVLFVVDAREGITPADVEFANLLRRSPSKVLMTANKVDTPQQVAELYEFYELGLGEIFPIAAATGSGTGDLLDALLALLPAEAADQDEDTAAPPRFAFVGKPNVGKSSLVNALLGRESQIVTPVAGTTRDSIDTRFQAFGMDVVLVDTAGLRRKARISDNIEFYSTLRTVRAIENCDVALLVIDATSGIEAQDMSIFALAQKQRKGIVIIVNKWDLVEKETNTARDFEELIREKTAPFTDLPILFTSAETRQRVLKAMEAALHVYENKRKRVPTHQLNEFLQEAVAKHHPPAHRGHIIHIKYATQVPASSPTFLLFANYPQHVQESYKRYLENQLRERFDFKGVPVNLFFRKK